MTSKRAAAPVEPVLGEPGKSSLGYLTLFELGNGQLRRAKSHGSAGFHLDKDKSLAILRNDIDFSGLTAKVPFDDAEPLPLKMCSSDCLAPLAKGLVICAGGAVDHVHAPSNPEEKPLPLLFQVFLDATERGAVYLARPQPGNSSHMGSAAISFVLGQPVTWVPVGIFNHEPISRDLGNYGSGSNGNAGTVALFDGSLMNTKRDFVYAVNQKQVRRRRKHQNCLLHSLQRGLQNIDPADQAVIAYANSDSNGIAP